MIKIYCNLPDGLPNQFDVFNSVGQNVGRYSLDRQTRNAVNVNLPTGIYITRLVVNNKIFTQKVLINQ